ncbi:MAG: M1 family metallopeptidase, partial [Bacteroidales bacterium]|nr:M1 family metallopeptidase [Bacteroidales bacterium]
MSGNIRIEYINNSPDTLQSIYFHCWPNAYRDNNTAFAKQQLLLRSTDFYYSDTENRGYIDSLAFTVDGHSASIQPTEFADVCLLKLPRILYPGDTIIIETPFYVKIPDSFSRMGHVGQTYQITQWYPKPAVYDQYGWHYMPYLDMGEFYSEFGRFDVSITVPADYVVAATGNLITRQELEWLEDLWLNPDNPRTKRDGLNQKTIRYVEENIHDFAWFADPDFRVYCDTVLLPGSGRPVRCWSFVNKENVELWSESVKYVKEAVRFYSARLGDYPYANCTAVDGALSAGSGMEYPGITIVSDGGSKSSLERVIVHEVGHNWFYGILASNER